MTKWVDSCKQFPDIVEKYQKGHAELQKTLNSYVANCSILSEVRALDKRKIAIDDWRTQAGYTDRVYDTWKHQSDGLQVRIQSLEQKLGCEPK
jgi:hypothetical protein